jgi:hypothetical protein
VVTLVVSYWVLRASSAKRTARSCAHCAGSAGAVFVHSFSVIIPSITSPLAPSTPYSACRSTMRSAASSVVPPMRSLATASLLSAMVQMFRTGLLPRLNRLPSPVRAKATPPPLL